MSKTLSESLFERFLKANGIPFRVIPVGSGRTADYELTPSGETIVCEVKEIQSGSVWNPDECHSSDVGGQIRRRINSSKGQLQTYARRGIATILIIFNRHDPLQLLGTENHDFAAAMYGDHTLNISARTGRIIGHFRGTGKAFQANKNTSFSALARLRSQKDSIAVSIFENIHAEIPIKYDLLPPCFEIIRGCESSSFQ